MHISFEKNRKGEVKKKDKDRKKITQKNYLSFGKNT